MTNTTTASKKADLIKARDEWDARNAEQKAKHDAQYAEFERKQDEILGGIKCKVAAALDGIDLDLEIEVSAGFSFLNRRATVCVRSNERRVHAEDKALSWTWEASLGDNGAVSRKSSSWSGLQATTAEQMESLRQTVRALEALNGIDWAATLDVTLPNYSDYVTEESSIGERPKFEADIRAAEIAELIGTDTLIKGTPSGGRHGGTAWYLIVSESPKQFEVAELAGYGVQEKYLEESGQTLAQAVRRAKNWTARISKEKFVNSIVGKAVETMAF